MSCGPPYRVAIICGEPSGDALGARLVLALRAGLGPDRLVLTGLGGERLAEQGLTSLFPLSDIAVMGFVAVAARLRTVLARIQQVVRAILAAPPDLIVTIDSPDFCLRVARAVRRANPAIPIVHWVCPSVWAWRPGRARAMRPHIDMIYTLLPFEPAELKALGGPPGLYVGHPLVERIDVLRLADAIERESCDDGVRPSILLLPGSRLSEINRLLPVFLETAGRLSRRHPDARFVLPAVAHVRQRIEVLLTRAPVPVELIIDEAAKWRAFRTARAALAASGTVTLELALSQVPTVAAYKVSWIEGAIARRMIRVPSVVLPNLVLGRDVVPAFLQEHCTPGALTLAMDAVIVDGRRRQDQLNAFRELDTRMGIGATLTPSDAVARDVIERLKSRPRDA